MTWVLDSTRIKQTFLRPTSDNGTSVLRWHTGFRRFCVTAVWGFFLFAAIVAEGAFTPAPKASVKALKVTKGKPFTSGLVFIDGKFIKPPYVVERYGNVIRINGVQATQPVIDWSEFLKTQSGLSVTKTEAPAPEEKSAPAPEPVPAAAEADDSDDPLDDLFDDEPAKPTRRKQTSHHAPAPKPKVTTTMKLDGEFEMNDRSVGLRSKINLKRTEIDAALRRGGFFCFGSSYSTVSGDKSETERILKELPKIMKGYSDPKSFVTAMRQAGFVYFQPRLVQDLFENRIDYLELQKRYKKVLEDKRFDAMLRNAGVQ